MLYIISKETFGDHNVRDIQCNSCWCECVLDGYASIPDALVEGILETRGYCDIALNEAQNEVVSFKARPIPDVPCSPEPPYVFTGSIILTEGVHYGETLPEQGIEGQLFFFVSKGETEMIEVSAIGNGLILPFIWHDNAWRSDVVDKDAVLYTEQFLTLEQKHQARRNIGAASVYETVAYVPQTFDPELQAQARANIGAASAEDIGDIETALDAIIAIQETLIGGGSV